MNGTTQIKAPDACTLHELEAFERFVRLAFDGSDENLPVRIRQACRLAFHYGGDGNLVAIAGLKAPSQTDREAVFGKAATAADPCDREFELGWVYVVPAYRLHGLGRDLCRKLLAGTSACGVFAKTRTDNARMAGILHDLGFRRDGAPIPRRSEKLHLYLGSGPPAA